MNLEAYGIVCPRCKHEIEINNNALKCPLCHTQYLITCGIIDLRFPQSLDDEITNSMKTHYKQSSFEDLLSIMLSEYQSSHHMHKDTLAYYFNQVDRTQRMTKMFIDSISKTFGSPKKERVLDLGCGSGAGVIALSQYFDQVIGLDSSMAQLILAKKALDDTTIANWILICGFANCLPFKDQSLNNIQAINVFEHVMVVTPVIQEISRTLTIGGTFSVDSRNRFDIFFPEPHTGIRLLGFLPRKFIPKFVDWCKRGPYEQTWLLSYKGLRRAMNRFFQGEYIISFPDVQAYHQPSWINKIVALINKIPIISNLTLRIFPTHIVIGKKLDKV